MTRIRQTFFSFLLAAVMLATASAASNETELAAVLEDYYTIYMDAMQTETPPDFSGLVETNENTKLYDLVIGYEQESGKYLDPPMLSYAFSMDVQDLEIQGNRADAEVVYQSKIQFDGMSEDEYTYRNIPYHFQLQYHDDGWKITNIDSGFFVHTDLIEEITSSAARSGNVVAEAENILNDRLERLENADLEMLRVGDEQSAESQRKLQALEAEDYGMEPRASRVSFLVDKAVEYADQYALKENSLFYTTVEDCTNFVSQCAWAGYGGWVKGDHSQTRENIANRFRMYYNSDTSKGWFAGTGGGSSPWENVSAHWNVIVDNEGFGARADGYNNNSNYQNLSAKMIFPGETLQFYSQAKKKYVHSVFVVSKSDSSYDKIYCDAHNAKCKHEPITTFIKSSGGSECRMRDMDYVSARFE